RRRARTASESHVPLRRRAAPLRRARAGIRRRAALLGKAATASVTGPGKLRFAARSEHLASFPEDVLAAFEKLPKPAALRRRHRDSVVPQRQRRGSLGSAVRLVVDEQPGRGGDVEGGENALDGLRLLVMAGIAGVDDVEQEV